MAKCWPGPARRSPDHWHQLVHYDVLLRNHDTCTAAKIINSMPGSGTQPKPVLKVLSVVVDGATLAVAFDWLMEPVAVNLGYWTWHGNGEIPFSTMPAGLQSASSLIPLSPHAHRQNQQIRHTFVIDPNHVFLTVKDLFMNWLVFIPVMFCTFAAMEGITLAYTPVCDAWFSLVPSWRPSPTPARFVWKNDAFFSYLPYPAGCWSCLGCKGTDWMAAIGFGIAPYGLFYFLVHDDHTPAFQMVYEGIIPMFAPYAGRTRCIINIWIRKTARVRHVLCSQEILAKGAGRQKRQSGAWCCANLGA